MCAMSVGSETECPRCSSLKTEVYTARQLNLKVHRKRRRKNRLKDTFSPMEELGLAYLPAYLKLAKVDEGISASVDLGIDVDEAKRRLEELIALETKNLHEVNADGPLHLPWEKLSEPIARLLLVKGVKQVAVPDPRVQGVRGRLTGLVLSTLRNIQGTDPLTLLNSPVRLRDLISTEPLTSRIISLTKPATDELSTAARILTGLNRHFAVPPALRASVVKAYRNLRKRAGKRRKLQRKNNRKNLEGDDAFQTSKPEDDETGDELSSETDESENEDGVGGAGVNTTSSEEEEDEIVPGQGVKSKYDTLPGDFSPKANLKCYVCHRRSKRDVNFETAALQQYPRMCVGCAEFNWERRNAKADLTGYIAIVTGGRIKIGYEIVMKLLRDGCHVITTTRFPNDAARRFAEEKDYSCWRNRLEIYPLELKDANGIYKFVDFVKKSVPHLDIIINNAAQTLRRPLSFYEHLLPYESLPRNELPDVERDLLATAQRLQYGSMTSDSMVASSCENRLDTLAVAPEDSGSVLCPKDRGTKRLSIDPLLNDAPQAKVQRTDSSCGPANTPEGWTKAVVRESDYFPVGARDEHGQQLDLRPTNSWRAVLEQVPVSELLEVFMVNTVAPFILNSELKCLMTRSAHERRFIVNVSAMEGQFSRSAKTCHHPHTNMAKAALNMMTRTGALSYREDAIYMTAVDTGWVTDERPHAMAAHERIKKGFILPLDCVDGAARVYDPIVRGVMKRQEPHFAVFLKNYAPYPW